jgi:hypothetical protein
MTAATWVLVGVILGLSVGFVAGVIGGILAGGRGPCAECQHWQALVDEQDDELRAKDAELAKADTTIDVLNRNIETMSRALACGPYVCDFPHPGDHRRWSIWTCPRCGTAYIRTRKRPQRWWRRRTFAPDGAWRIAPWWARR